MTPAPVTSTATSRPRLSTQMCRLRPATFFPASNPVSPPWPAALTDWLSTAELAGDSSRPACARQRRQRASWTASRVPSARHRRYQVWTVLHGGKHFGRSRHWHPVRTR